MKVLIRVDASAAIGSGHVMRTLTLAQELASRGAAIRFVCRDLPGHLGARILGEGHELRLLPAPTDAAGLSGYARWLGVTPERDATEFLAAARGFRADWLVVDHYALDAGWEMLARKSAGAILAIDDLADRAHDCDLLLDQNYFGAATAQRYAGLVPAGASTLTGPRHALLRPEFRQLRALTGERDGIVRRLLVFFGATDAGNQTAEVLRALRSPELAHLAADVVVGVNHPDFAGLATLAKTMLNVKLHRDLPSLALLMAQADLAVGAGGSTTWERACLGLPALVQIAAENQRGFTQALTADGLQLGVPEQFDFEQWRAAIARAISSPATLARMSRDVRALTDGFGAARVGATMYPEAARDLRLRVEPSGTSGAETAVELAERRSGLSYARAKVRAADGVELIENVEVESPRPDARLRDTLLARLASRGGSPVALPGGQGLSLTLLTDAGSWVNEELESFAAQCIGQGHRLRWIHDVAALRPADVCFVLSFSALLPEAALELHRHNLVVHASALPQGRGWSPMTWHILEGRSEFTLTLFEATPRVDAGVIYAQKTLRLGGHELADEWRRIQVEGIAELCARWLDRFPDSVKDAREQQGEPSFLGRRTPADSALDVHRPLSEQFDLLRVVDNERYPAWFEFRGHRYTISIKETS